MRLGRSVLEDCLLNAKDAPPAVGSTFSAISGVLGKISVVTTAVALALEGGFLLACR